MSPLRMIYLGLAILGAVVPMVYFPQWLQANGFDIARLLEDVRTNAAAAAVFWTLMISGSVLSVFVVAEVSVRRNWVALVAIPVTLLIGLGCGLPLYLFLRTRPTG
ncbi:MAG: DUF2834 domain-containing protein [Rhodobacteraceae bacterium]|nr:DUF2834 domain-containing protein [Paracoccaceae bacterium]